MKKFILAAIAIAIIATSALVIMAATNKSATPSGKTVTRTHNLGNFRELEVSQINVEFTQSPAGQAVLKAPADIIDKIVIEKDDDEIKVYVKGNKFNKKSNINATLTLSSNAIENIEANCAAMVNISGELRSADEINLSASTAATINTATVSCRDAEIESTTAATVNINRMVCTGKLDADASTAGTINIKGGTAAYATLEASTAGNVNVKADLGGGIAEASTGGNITAPTDKLAIKTSAGGSVNTK